MPLVIKKKLQKITSVERKTEKPVKKIKILPFLKLTNPTSENRWPL
tara:strand:- start:1019 stop:1156 length:138 start_codon:yes stop_codon:yes gene_type:complete